MLKVPDSPGIGIKGRTVPATTLGQASVGPPFVWTAIRYIYTMSGWSPREAAEYRAAADAQLLRRIATDATARRGVHRLVGIARGAGYSEIAVAGVRLRRARRTNHRAGETMGAHGVVHRRSGAATIAHAPHSTAHDARRRTRCAYACCSQGGRRSVAGHRRVPQRTIHRSHRRPRGQSHQRLRWQRSRPQHRRRRSDRRSLTRRPMRVRARMRCTTKFVWCTPRSCRHARRRRCRLRRRRRAHQRLGVSKLVWRKHLTSRNNFPRRRPPAFIIDPARIGADVLVMTQTIFHTTDSALLRT